MSIAMNNYILFWLCIIGLCLGSFFNVVILRSLKDESIIFPPSKCPKCNNKLKPWHNIPVLSFIFLGGKCAFCKEKISIQYPLVEIATMVLFAWNFISFGLTWKCLFGIILTSCMLIMTVTDIREKLVDCNLAIILAIVGFFYNGVVNNLWLDSLFGLIAGAIFMEILARVGYLFSDERAFGEADTYVAGALGASFGFVGIFQVFLYTLFASMLFVLPVFIARLFKNKNKTISILLILFILFAVIYKTLIQNWYILGTILSIGIVLTILLVKNIKKNSELLYLPLVPAFFLGTLYFLFF